MFLRRGSTIHALIFSPGFELQTKRHTYLIVLFMIFGGLVGTLFAFAQCRAGSVSLPSVSELSFQICSGSIFRLLTVCCLFSLLVVLAGCTGVRTFSYGALFFLKGFSIAFLIFVFSYFYRSQGLMIAASVLLFHSFLLLPLQIISAVSLLPDCQLRSAKVVSLSLLNAVGCFTCMFCERFLLPHLLHY